MSQRNKYKKFRKCTPIVQLKIDEETINSLHLVTALKYLKTLKPIINIDYSEYKCILIRYHRTISSVRSYFFTKT